MHNYTINIYGTVSASVEVQAEDYDQTVDLAFENAPQTDFGFAGFSAVDEWQLSEGYEMDGGWFDE